MRFDSRSHCQTSTHADSAPLFGQRMPGGDRPAVGPCAPRVRRHPSMQLLHAVMRLAGPCAELMSHAERPWASVTFSGTRHTITLSFAGTEGLAAGEAFVAALPEHEFSIRGQLVADATISEMTQLNLPHPYMVLDAELLLLSDD
ncbi:MAG TPA: hypothetical protein VN222_13500 [Novosphingobium sp.]|nr:hypothetical protein [Novosphingobium sp.]